MGSGMLRLLGLAEPSRDRLGLDRRQDYEAVVEDEHRLGPAAVGDVDEIVLVPCLLDEALDRRGFGGHHYEDVVERNDAAEPDVY